MTKEHTLLGRLLFSNVYYKVSSASIVLLLAFILPTFPSSYFLSLAISGIIVSAIFLFFITNENLGSNYHKKFVIIINIILLISLPLVFVLSDLTFFITLSILCRGIGDSYFARNGLIVVRTKNQLICDLIRLVLGCILYSNNNEPVLFISLLVFSNIPDLTTALYDRHDNLPGSKSKIGLYKDFLKLSTKQIDSLVLYFLITSRLINGELAVLYQQIFSIFLLISMSLWQYEFSKRVSISDSIRNYWKHIRTPQLLSCLLLIVVMITLDLAVVGIFGLITLTRIVNIEPLVILRSDHYRYPLFLYLNISFMLPGMYYYGSNFMCLNILVHMAFIFLRNKRC